tara:strand:- start:261 stop:542 length:282 start_codon:yes stop_codon:yes gene_type:complete
MNDLMGHDPWEQALSELSELGPLSPMVARFPEGMPLKFINGRPGSIMALGRSYRTLETWKVFLLISYGMIMGWWLKEFGMKLLTELASMIGLT